MNDIKSIIYAYLPDNHYEIISKVIKFRYYNIPKCDYVKKILKSVNLGLLFISLNENLILTRDILHKIENNYFDTDDLFLLQENNTYIKFLRYNVINVLIDNTIFTRMISYQNIIEKLIMYCDFSGLKYPNVLFLSRNKQFYYLKKSKNNIFYRKYV